MPPHITLHQAPGTWVVRVGDVVLGKSAQVQHLTEGARAPVPYFPRADMNMALLDATTHGTTCPHKGQASYFSIVLPDRTLTNAVWSYQLPLSGCDAIAGHLAFYPDRVIIEQA